MIAVHQIGEPFTTTVRFGAAGTREGRKKDGDLLDSISKLADVDGGARLAEHVAGKKLRDRLGDLRLLVGAPSL